MGSKNSFTAPFGMTLKTFKKSSKESKHLCASQRQTIIKLLEKPNKDKRYIAN